MSLKFDRLYGAGNRDQKETLPWKIFLIVREKGLLYFIYLFIYFLESLNPNLWLSTKISQWILTNFGGNLTCIFSFFFFSSSFFTFNQFFFALGIKNLEFREVEKIWNKKGIMGDKKKEEGTHALGLIVVENSSRFYQAKFMVVSKTSL